MTQSRLARLRGAMQEMELPAFLVTQTDNVGYVSGFTGSSAALIILADRATLVTDGRYTSQARRECPEFTIRQTDPTQHLVDRLAAEINELGASPVGIEAASVTLQQFDTL